MYFNRQNNYQNNQHPTNRAFTLVEVIVSTLILGIMISGMLFAFHRTKEGTYQYALRERAAAVGQRRLEMLLSTYQEPNNLYLYGKDDLDPLFSWTLNLERILVDETSLYRNVENTIIKATVSVEADLPDMKNQPLITLVRYFDVLAPLPGNDVAVPLPLEPTARWLEELTEKLGREPTLDEILLEMVNQGEITSDMLRDLGISRDMDIIRDI